MTNHAAASDMNNLEPEGHSGCEKYHSVTQICQALLNGATEKIL